MTAARFWTAQQILDQAAIECGLSAPGANVYSSTDSNVVLLRSLLNTAGQELTIANRWPYPLTREHTITVANPGDSGSYTLPDDWNGIVDQTGFDRTTAYELVPLGPETWQWIKTGAVTSVLTVNFRLDAETLRVETVPANGTVLALEYHSRYWVKPNGQALPTAASCTASTDVVYYDNLLITALTALRFQEKRGMDSTVSLRDFERRFDLVTGRANASPVLSLSRRGGIHFIDRHNFRDTGYGS